MLTFSQNFKWHFRDNFLPKVFRFLMAGLCGICIHHYEDPRVFPCLHSFCKNCISNLVVQNEDENNDIFCPKCGFKFNIKPEDVPKLPQNFGVTNLLPILKLHYLAEDKTKKIECENCKGKKPAIGRCNDCRVFMCSPCSAAHQKIQALQKHNVVNLETVKRAEPCQLAKQLSCQTHENEPLKLYCETCHVPICRDCTIFEHQSHNFKKIHDVIQGEKRHIAISISEAVNQIPGLESTLKDIKNMKARILTKANMAEKDVDAFIDTQVRILQQIRTELKTGVHTVSRTKVHSLNIQEEQIAQHLSNIKTGVQFARQAVSNGSESEILSIKEQIVSRLLDLTKKPYDSTPCQDDGIAFVVNHKKTVRDFIPELANLDSSTAMASLCSLDVIGGEPDLMYTTFCDQSCEFLITLRDHFGQRLKSGGSRVMAAITGCPVAQQEAWGVNNMKFLELTDNNDGTYCVSYLPRFPGKYMLSVAIDKSHIKGSPFCWYVSQKLVNINRCKLESTSNTNGFMFQGSSTTIHDIIIDGGYCFSWRVKYRSKLYTSGSRTSTHSTNAFSAPSWRSLSSQQSIFPLFQGCKIGVVKASESLPSSETSFESVLESELSRQGSVSYTSLKGLVKDKWFWCDGFCYSPTDPSGTPSNITNFEDGDVFVLFLNPVKKTLMIYNRGSEQRDCIAGVEFPVRPYLKG